MDSQRRGAAHRAEASREVEQFGIKITRPSKRETYAHFNTCRSIVNAMFPPNAAETGKSRHQGTARRRHAENASGGNAGAGGSAAGAGNGAGGGR
jgi:hypothetical protein